MLARLGLPSMVFPSGVFPSGSLAWDDNLGRALPITSSRGLGACVCAVELGLAGMRSTVCGCLGDAASDPSAPAASGRLPPRRFDVRIGGGAPACGPRTLGVSGVAAEGPIEGFREPAFACAIGPGWFPLEVGGSALRDPFAATMGRTDPEPKLDGKAWSEPVAADTAADAIAPEPRFRTLPPAGLSRPLPPREANFWAAAAAFFARSFLLFTVTVRTDAGLGVGTSSTESGRLAPIAQT
mmetsp:Transcript_74882/g.171619  ORF Transcript_74882/g.171619 Transcript_74882/m.171619 type:complete len:240 (-) Transcript_74882:2034-2753(-)